MTTDGTWTCQNSVTTKYTNHTKECVNSKSTLSIRCFPFFVSFVYFVVKFLPPSEIVQLLT